MSFKTAAVGSISGLYRRAVELVGWKAGGVAALLGLLGGAAHAPLHLWPVLALALSGFVWLLDGAAARPAPLRAAAWRGLAFGFGYFLAGLWWVGNAFLVEGTYPYLAPLAVVLLPLGLGLFWAIGAAAAVRFWSQSWRRVLVLAVVFSVVEYARGHVLTGFPWNLAGHVWTAGGPVSQVAAYIGVYGLTALTWAGLAAPATLGGPDTRWSVRLAPTLAAAAAFVALGAGGAARLAAAGEAVPTEVQLRIVQAQFSQDEKWRPENRDVVRARYLALTRESGLETRTHVIWPESALPVLLLEEPRTLDAISNTLSDGQVLLTGAVRRDVSNPIAPKYYNSLIALAMVGRSPVVEAIYDKQKLVPFGEFTPFAETMKKFGVGNVASVDTGFTAGPGPMSLDIPGAPSLAPQVCYEVIFPGFTPRGADRPGWILNVSNDAWYGNTSGPRQHFNQSRYRSIEEGLPLARAASGGTSAVVDAYGRTQDSLAIYAETVLDAPLPAALPPTVYALIGDAGFWVIMFLMAAAGLIGGGRRNTTG